MSLKIRNEHLSRLAFIYIRQSTMIQVLEHQQSTERQYDLADLAKRLGWDAAQVEVIDEDLGLSGASAAGRSGFQRLVAEVSLGRVGAIFSLEVSRLARSSADWHRLLDLCAISNSLIIDDDGVYDPNDFNDRLVLGMKGTMSDAERHIMRLRLLGGRFHKAKKGQLTFHPPTGYVFDENASLVLDPDERVQRAVRLLFDRFRIGGTLFGVVRYFAQHKLQFPSRHKHKSAPAEMRWKKLTYARAISAIQNPIYAGAYVYGRRKSRRILAEDGVKWRRERLLQDQWHTLLREAHPGYITWEDYMGNLKRLRENASVAKDLDQKSAARSGAALLQGLTLCGRCGRRMKPTYKRAKRPKYECRDKRNDEHTCWSVPARNIDVKVAELLLDMFAPSEIDLSFAVFKEVERQADDVDRQWKLRLERARYEAERAERQYDAVEPENRVVARTLETRWNEKLQELRQVERAHEEARRAKKLDLTEKDKTAILALARDLPRIWSAPTTTNDERKRIIRLLIQDVTLVPIDVPERATKIRLLWKTGAISEALASRPKCPWKTPKAILDLIRDLAKRHFADIQIANELNRRGLKSGFGKCFTGRGIHMIRIGYDVPSGRDPGGHLPSVDRDSRGRYSVRGLAARYEITTHIVRYWIKMGVVEAKRDYQGGPFWMTITPQIESRIRKAMRNGYGPGARSGPKDHEALKQKTRVHHSNARPQRER
jgi:DNA invertase Pin-like site-specific DNA recombinase